MEVPTQSSQVAQSNVPLVQSSQLVHSNVVQQPLHIIGGSGDVVRDYKSAEDDEELAFQMTLFMLAEAEKKAQIALVDEEYAFKEQLGADGNGKSLYVKYPNLDRIKGDALFFPLSAVTNPVTNPVTATSSQPKQGNTQQYQQPKHSNPQPKQPLVAHSSNQTTIPGNVKNVVEAAGMNIRKGDASMLYGQSNTVQHRTPYRQSEEYSLLNERAPLIPMAQYTQPTAQPPQYVPLMPISQQPTTQSTAVTNTKPFSIFAQPFVPKSHNPN